MLWTSVIVMVTSAVVAQDFYPDRSYGAGTRPSRDHLYGSQRRFVDRTYQGTHVNTGFGLSRSRKVLHEPVLDTGYIGQKPVHTVDHGYVKPVRHGQLDTGYEKAKRVGPLDAAYVPTKPLGPIHSEYVGPKLPIKTKYVQPKRINPLGKDYVGTKIPGPGDVGYVDPSPFGGPMEGELIDPIIGHGKGHPVPPVGPFYGELANTRGVSTSDFVAVGEAEDVALPLRRNDLRDPSWNVSPGNHLEQGGFPHEQRLLPSDLRSEGLIRQRNNMPLAQDFPHSQQRVLSRPSKPLPPPMVEKKITKKTIGRTAAEKRRYYQKLRKFQG